MSRRAAFQLSHTTGTSLSVHIGATYRRTELLPRRTDLNLVAQAGFRDQHGRPVYGTLRQQGQLLAPESGSNRRFIGYDVVSAVGVDGWSDYRALHARVQVRPFERLTLDARYTRSTTEDNWFMARQGSPQNAVSPFPENTDDWAEGISDFDLPNRVVVGAELTLPVLQGLQLAALYRYQSGYPFTPGFRDGVDANGDGSLRNDPAFIDDGVSGFDAIADRWPCLRSQSNAFVERNSCRAPAQSFLDARLALRLGSPLRNAELIIDGFNLVSSGADDLDGALYLIDENAALTMAGNVVTIPLKVNTRFGEPLQRIGAARSVRVGLRVKF